MDHCNGPSESAEQVDTMDNEPSTKRRRIHMTDIEIVEFEKTQEGSAALSKPSSVIKSNKDPNRGLYPRAAWRRKPSASQSTPNESSGHASSSQVSNSKTAPEKFGMKIGFQKASNAINPELPFLPSSQGTSSSQGSESSTHSSGYSQPKTYPKPKKSVLRSPIKKGKFCLLNYL